MDKPAGHVCEHRLSGDGQQGNEGVEVPSVCPPLVPLQSGCLACRVSVVLETPAHSFPSAPAEAFRPFFFESSPLRSRCYVYLDDCDEARPRRRFGVSKARSCAKRRGRGKVEARGPGNATMDSISTVHTQPQPHQCRDIASSRHRSRGWRGRGGLWNTNTHKTRSYLKGRHPPRPRHCCRPRTWPQEDDHPDGATDLMVTGG